MALLEQVLNQFKLIFPTNRIKYLEHKLRSVDI